MQMLGKYLENTKFIFYIFNLPPPLFKKRSRATEDLRKAHSHLSTPLRSKALFLICYLEFSLLSEAYEYSEKLFAGFMLQLVA